LIIFSLSTGKMLAKRIFGFRVVLGLPAVGVLRKLCSQRQNWRWVVMFGSGRGATMVCPLSLCGVLDRRRPFGWVLPPCRGLVLVIWQPIINCLVIGIFGSICWPFLYTTVKIAPVYSQHLLRRDGTVER